MVLYLNLFHTYCSYIIHYIHFYIFGVGIGIIGFYNASFPLKRENGNQNWQNKGDSIMSLKPFNPLYRLMCFCSFIEARNQSTQKKAPVGPGNHIPSHLQTTGIKLGPQWWKASVITTEPAVWQQLKFMFLQIHYASSTSANDQSAES